MPSFGLCVPLDVAPQARDAGFDYLEGSVQSLLQGDTPDDAWTGRALVDACPLPVPAVNSLLPGDLKIVGPSVDQRRIETYLSRIFPRAVACGTTTVVFGAGGARRIPDGFDRDAAREQIVAFAKLAGRHAADAGVTLVFEPLNRGESNVINSVAEAMTYVDAVAMPGVRCLVDSYHFWIEREPLGDLAAAMPSIAHVHVADEHGRDVPGFATTPSDYRAFFATLKRGGYDGRVSVESSRLTPDRFAACVAFLRDQWARA